MNNFTIHSGADLGGGGGGADALFSGIRPPADPKGPPFDTFSEIHFWPNDPKIFLKTPSAAIYTNFEVGARAEKTQLFGQNFPKSALKRLFDCFFKFLPAAQKILPKKGPNHAKGELKNLYLVDLKKKKVVKIFDFFLKIRPPPSRKS